MANAPQIKKIKSHHIIHHKITTLAEKYVHTLKLFLQTHTFQSAILGKGQARLDYILTKQVDRRLVRSVNV